MILLLHAAGQFGISQTPGGPFLLRQGVSFFFVLSGFILVYVYGELEGVRARTFLRARIARIWPAHVAALLLLLLLVPAAQIAATGVRVSALFLIGTYFIHTIGELLLSPVGLSTFSRLAPERYTSQMMGFWFVASSLGNLMAGLLAAGMDTANAAGLPDAFMRIFMTSAAFGLILLLLARPLTRWALGGDEHIEETAPAP